MAFRCVRGACPAYFTDVCIPVETVAALKFTRKTVDIQINFKRPRPFTKLFKMKSHTINSSSTDILLI